VEGFSEHGIEPSGSIEFWEVLEWLHNWRLLKEGSAPRVSMKQSCSQEFFPVRTMNFGIEYFILEYVNIIS
jgi:hypothetical protein